MSGMPVCKKHSPSHCSVARGSRETSPFLTDPAELFLPTAQFILCPSFLLAKYENCVLWLHNSSQAANVGCGLVEEGSSLLVRVYCSCTVEIIRKTVVSLQGCEVYKPLWVCVNSTAVVVKEPQHMLICVEK